MVLSTGGGSKYDKSKVVDGVLSSSSSKSLSSASSSSSQSVPLPPSFLHETSKAMEETWKDITLSSLHAHQTRDRGHLVNPQNPKPTANIRSMILQDFLARPFDKDSSTDTGIYGSGSPAPPPGAMLSLISNSDFHFQSPPISNAGSFNSPFDALASSSGLLPFSRKRFQAPENNSGDRRNKRMIKNRESAARSRGRKQAYTNELELEVSHLMEENARLKKQQEQLLRAASAQVPKKLKLQRTLTAPF